LKSEEEKQMVSGTTNGRPEVSKNKSIMFSET
jgi:hypothetical protein